MRYHATDDSERWGNAYDALQELRLHGQWERMLMLAEVALDDIPLTHTDFVAYPAVRSLIKQARYFSQSARKHYRRATQ